MPVILLIRHGLNDQTGKSLVGRRPGVHLNQTGREQAEAVAAALTGSPVNAIYSSPLERAAETAGFLGASKKLPIQFQDALSEVDYGDLTGKTAKQLAKMKIWKVVKQSPSQVVFPKGEALPDVQKRVVNFLESLRNQYGEKDVVACFSHSDVIKQAAAHYLEMSFDAFPRLTIDPCSITTIFFDKTTVQVLGVNQQVAYQPPASVM